MPLILCGTPIGNLGDTSRRLAEALKGADVVFAEDTRRSRTLLDHLGIDKPLRSFFAGNEQLRVAELSERLARGETVALVTDAGMPAISDPGLAAVRTARAVGANVTVVPGPSAVTAALAVSGLPSERFVFEGFLPRKGGDRSRRIDQIAGETRTTVFFASPRRVGSDLEDLAGVAGGERAVFVGRELTKLHEELWWGTLGEAADRFRGSQRGEFTVVVGGAPVREPDLDEALEEVRVLMAEGEPLAGAVREVAQRVRVSRGRLYEAALKEKG
ncbi:ribosomal RNA small subunit methyltransferase I [bacterium BMS3Abin02]|nr:ribosomal RNA small subunit methyltransferase I [bacterium BMS3Abin02]GBE23112.1 ribosomal RNA small subunit methyltransferase I [bacterium BMS3Bbin01]HDH24710.1 16S rRNA (cytidine(1402)-2'-O)-methyltransferase [Actinomycetota bacterium]HDL49461.1 16S rRNA (cytidine(1402)-2'-O)-methyltransferase [Actinomycetota bacterium]